MKTLADMGKDERSLLLYLESRCVDNRGLIDGRRMNEDDFAILKDWKSQGFINYGRIAFADLKEDRSHWCEFSEEAWKLAHEERKARSERMMKDISVERLGITQQAAE